MREKDYYGAIKGFCLKWNLPEVWNSDRITGANLIYEVVKVINAMIVEQKEVKEMIEDFISTFGDKLDEKVVTVLNEWYESGKFDDIINEALFNGKLDKNIFYTYKDNVDEKINRIDNVLINSCSVLDFGADPTGLTDSSQAFIDAFQNSEIVFVPSGDYLFYDEIIIESSYKVRKIIGTDRNTTHLRFNKGGIVIQKGNIKISGIYLHGNSGSGLKIEGVSWVDLHDIRLSYFDIGVDLATSDLYMITIRIKDVISSYNNFYGFYVKSRNSNERNVITFENCYSNRNGFEQDIWESPATPNLGHGWYFDGVNGVLLTSCVSEYNTGAGIMVNSKNHQVKGYTSINHWFEGNKYAQLFIDNDRSENNKGESNFKSFISMGSYFGAGAYALSPNAISNRNAEIKSFYPLLKNKNNDISIEGFNYGSLMTDLIQLNNRNVIPKLNDLSLFKNDYPDSIVKFNDEYSITLTPISNTFSAYSILGHLESDTTYRVRFRYINLSGVKTSPLAFILYNQGDPIISKSIDVGEWTPEWTTDFIDYSFVFYNLNEQTFRVFTQIWEPAPNTNVRIKDISVEYLQNGIAE